MVLHDQKLMVNNGSRTAMFQGLLLAIVVTAVSAGVAPGDEEQLCEQLRAQGTAPIPAYSANMRVLMDSWNYQNLLPTRTGAVWDQVDNDTNNAIGFTTNVSAVYINKLSIIHTMVLKLLVFLNQWIQQSNIPCQQSVQVCGFSAGPQDNWLITQLINRTVNGARLPQVSVMIEFEQRNCDITLNCQQTFNTHVYEISTDNSTEARNLSNYQQVQSVSPDNTGGNRENETVTVNFSTNHSSFYFAVEDEKTCMVITRLIVFYTVCPAQTANLIQYPETISPSTNPQRNLSSPVTASCIENAEPENGIAPIVSCGAEGIKFWKDVVPGEGCHCVSGYFRENETCTRKLFMH